MTAVFERILEMSLTAAVVILVVMAIRLLLRKAPRKYSYALWSVAAFRLVCPVSFQAVFSLFSFTRRLEKIQVEQSVIEPLPTTFPDGVLSTPPGMVGDPIEVDPEYLFTYPAATPPAAEPEVTVNLLERAVDIAAVVWLVGLAALLVYGVVSYLRLRRRMSTAILFGDNIWQSDRVRSPFILGFIKPKIYLPFGLTDDQRRYVLAHERYHLKRFDHIVRPLSFLILAAHWFNPLVWAAYYLMSRDMEMSCDEKVLSGGESVKAYSTTLLAFAANRRFPSLSPLAFGEGGVKGRIKNALNWKKPRTWVTMIAILVCIVVIVVCAANPVESPYNWTSTVTAEDVEWAELMVNSEEWVTRTLSQQEVEELVALLNGIKRGDMSKPDPNGVWGFPTERMVTLCCGGIEYKLNLGPSPMTIICHDESVDWQGADEWFVGSDALKAFVRELAEPEAKEDPPVQEPETPPTWYADLTHDGVDETITLTREDETMIYSITVTDASGQELWRGEASDWRGGQNGIYLYKKDGKHYLMEWVPAAQQGWYSYHYRVFSLDGDGSPTVLAENSIQYDVISQSQVLEVDVDALREFEAEVNALLVDTVALLVIHNEETILGDSSAPVTSLWTSPAGDWERQRLEILDRRAEREANTLAVWPLNDLTLTVLKDGSGSGYIDVYRSNDYYYWSTAFDPAADDLLYFRYEENGRQYLMELQRGGGQGIGMWSYRVFSVGPESLTVLRENSLYYEAVSAATVLAVDVEAIRAFEAEVNALLEHAELIAGIGNNRFIYNVPGGSTAYQWPAGEAQRIEELQAYWREMEEKLNGAVAGQCNSYYVENLMQAGGRGYGQFVMLDKYMAKKGTAAYLVASFVELDKDGNWLAEYSNIPMMFTFDIVDDQYVLTEAWVEEKGTNYGRYEDMEARFPAAAAQAVMDDTYGEQLRQSIYGTLEQPAFGVTLGDGVDVPGAVEAYAAGYIRRAHPNAQAAEITGLEDMDLAHIGLVDGRILYRLSYRVKENGRWLDGPTGEEQVYLAVYFDWSSSSVYWNGCGFMTEGEIWGTYDTPEWYAKYPGHEGDPLSAYHTALAELWQQWKANR